MKKYYFKRSLVVAFALFIILPVHAVHAKIPTPQIYNVVHSADNANRPWVIGWTPNEVEVEVFMDEVFQGYAKVVKDDSGTASFGWSPQQDLSLGWHEFRVRGKYHDDFSEFGGIIGYKVSPPTPAPTLFAPEDFTDYVLIKGLIKNDSVVNIYIDGYLAADFAVPNHPSGTTNFWFKAKDLLNGVHEVYAVAYDVNGKPSKKSEIINFKTEQQKITKGEDENVENILDTPVNQVIDEPAVGEVTIVDGPADVLVEVSTPENNEIITTDVTTTDGEISSVSEINEESVTAEAVQDRANKNRYIGLLLLGLATILLYIWYWQEKKKVNKENK